MNNIHTFVSYYTKEVEQEKIEYYIYIRCWNQQLLKKRKDLDTTMFYVCMYCILVSWLNAGGKMLQMVVCLVTDGRKEGKNKEILDTWWWWKWVTSLLKLVNLSGDTPPFYIENPFYYSNLIRVKIIILHLVEWKLDGNDVPLTHKKVSRETSNHETPFICINY